MKVKLKRYKVPHIIGQSAADQTALEISGVSYQFDKIYTVGSDIKKPVYDENKHLFTELKEK